MLILIFLLKNQLRFLLFWLFGHFGESKGTSQLHLAKEHGVRLIDKLNQLTQVDEAYVERFASKWFKSLDKLPEDTSQFTRFLSENVKWNMPEDQFVGHHGFNEWYCIARNTFKPGCNHQIQAMSVTKSEVGFDVKLTIQLTAETHPNSEFKGDKIKILVNENWKLRYSNSKGLLITHYEVTPA